MNMKCFVTTLYGHKHKTRKAMCFVKCKLSIRYKAAEILSMLEVVFDHEQSNKWTLTLGQKHDLLTFVWVKGLQPFLSKESLWPIPNQKKGRQQYFYPQTTKYASFFIDSKMIHDLKVQI